MSDLFWPGDHRAGNTMSSGAFFAALVTAENTWLATLVGFGVAPPAAAADLRDLVSATDMAQIAIAAERDGNPVTALVAVLRARVGGEPARWLHRGLTSQDVVDTALMLCLRDGFDAVRTHVAAQVRSLVGLVESHRDTPMLTRTLTQPALPGTAGRKFGVWLTGILDAVDTLPPVVVSAGGAAGTLAATTELTGSAVAAIELADRWANALGLAPAPPWHTTRTAVTRAGDGLVACCDAWGRVANDVATGGRAEIGEFAEGSGGASSTMPHKNNPVLTVLLKRTALVAPQLGATLHLAAAAGIDERADGGWHAEWATLATLARRSVTAAAQAADLLGGLRVNSARAAANLAVAQGILAEQHAMAELAGTTAQAQYLGAADLLVDAVLVRARDYLEETR